MMDPGTDPAEKGLRVMSSPAFNLPAEPHGSAAAGARVRNPVSLLILTEDLAIPAPKALHMEEPLVDS